MTTYGYYFTRTVGKTNETTTYTQTGFSSEREASIALSRKLNSFDDGYDSVIYYSQIHITVNQEPSDIIPDDDGLAGFL